MAKRKITNGADVLVSALEELGVRCVFGLPGTQNVALFESLRSSRIRVVLTTSETTAGFMANGWFRASGQPSVFVGIAGPGFAWAIPPLAEAALDSAAVILITPKPLDRGFKYDLQTLAQEDIATSLGCVVRSITDPGTLRTEVFDAWSAASTGGPRPVVIHVDSEVLDLDDFNAQSGTQGVAQPVEISVPDDLIARLVQAERPVIMAGAGTLPCPELVTQLIDLTGAVIITTPTARGVVREDHPLCLRLDLMRDRVDILNDFLESADLVISLGCRFSHNGTGGYKLKIAEQKLAHVDLDDSVIGENYPARWAIRADAKGFLEHLLRVVSASSPTQSSSRQVGAVNSFRDQQQAVRKPIPGEPVWMGLGNCKTLFSRIREGLDDNAILVTDTGLHQILTRTYFDVLSPRGLIVPTDFQSMGFGLPAAIGAALAVTDRPVTALIGDGGLLMVGGELATASRESIPLPVLVFRDGFLGQIRLQQLTNYGVESATELQAYDLQAFCESLGAKHVLAGANLADQMRMARERAGPTVIEVQLADGDELDNISRRVRRKMSIKSAIGPGIVRLVRRLR